MDIGAIMKLKRAWDCFGENHPKFRSFLEAFAARDLPDGTVIEIQVKYPDGSAMKSNLKVSRDDAVLIEQLRHSR